jgi:hypothetical protein
MAVSFHTDILPLFTSVDVEHMSGRDVSLDDYSYMSRPENATKVHEAVAGGWMPPGSSGEQPWPEDKVELFKRWMDEGYAP